MAMMANGNGIVANGYHFSSFIFLGLGQQVQVPTRIGGLGFLALSPAL